MAKSRARKFYDRRKRYYINVRRMNERDAHYAARRDTWEKHGGYR
jgi:hypothetical protein